MWSCPTTSGEAVVTYQFLTFMAVAPMLWRREHNLVALHASMSRRAGLFAIIGLMAGLLVQIAVATATVGALATALPPMVSILQGAGAGFLVLVGLQTMKDVAASSPEGPRFEATTANPWEDGLLATLASARAWGVAVVVLPALLQVPELSLLAPMVLVAGLGLVCIGAVVWAILSIVRHGQPAAAVQMNKSLTALAGGVLVGLGARALIAVLS